VTYRNLVILVARSSGLTSQIAREVVNLVFAHLSNGIIAAKGRAGRTKIPGFGTFNIRRRKARSVRNPKTNEPMWLASSKTVGFRAAKRLKERIP